MKNIRLVVMVSFLALIGACQYSHVHSLSTNQYGDPSKVITYDDAFEGKVYESNDHIIDFRATERNEFDRIDIKIPEGWMAGIVLNRVQAGYPSIELEYQAGEKQGTQFSDHVEESLEDQAGSSVILADFDKYDPGYCTQSRDIKIINGERTESLLVGGLCFTKLVITVPSSDDTVVTVNGLDSRSPALAEAISFNRSLNSLTVTR